MRQRLLEGRALHIFPCGLDKRPTIRDWYNCAVSDQASITALWLRRPGLLVGVPTGVVNGIDVIDIDPRNGGDTWLREHEQRLPVTRTHKTRSGGLHLIYRHVI